MLSVVLEKFLLLNLTYNNLQNIWKTGRNQLQASNPNTISKYNCLKFLIIFLMHIYLNTVKIIMNTQFCFLGFLNNV